MSATADVPVKWSIFSSDAPSWWLDEVLDTTEAAAVLGVSRGAFLKRAVVGWCKCGWNGKRRVTTRRWLAEAMLKEVGQDGK